MAEIEVNLGERSYVIHVGAGVLANLGAVIAAVREPTFAAVVTNPTVARFHGDAVLASLRAAGIGAELVLVPAGERYKKLSTVNRIYEALLDLKLDRKGAVMALGGGVIGDMAGFAAATYMRGVDLYQVPTTMLAQVDSSVGGKTGVDLPRGKNLVGAFYQPRAVVADISTLRTLPARELRAGLAEVIKHGIIYDQSFFAVLDARASELLAKREDALEFAVTRSIEIKRDVVETDERESGLRAILNYGHTVSHAIEVLAGYGKYRHGEAHSIGMITEALLAEREGVAEKGTTAAITATLQKVRLPVRMDDTLDTADMIRAIEHDKKTLGGVLRLALPTRIGACEVVEGVRREALAGAIDAHRKLLLQDE